MAALPAPRVTPAFPFNIVGVDYAGPFLLTAHSARGQRTSKNYAAIFVCFTTKAVHLENVEDYSTAGSLAALESCCQKFQISFKTNCRLANIVALRVRNSALQNRGVPKLTAYWGTIRRSDGFDCTYSGTFFNRTASPLCS